MRPQENIWTYEMEMDKESENKESISGSYYKWSRFSLLYVKSRLLNQS